MAQAITADFLKQNPQKAFKTLSEIVSTGNPELWAHSISSALNVTGLTDARGRNLLHAALEAAHDNPEMVRSLWKHGIKSRSDWQDFLNREDHSGVTPRSLAVALGKTESAEILMDRGAVMPEHYEAAEHSVSEITFIDRQGKILQSGLKTAPEENDWGIAALSRLRRELAQVAAWMPELAQAHVKRGARYVITEGPCVDFQRYVMGTDEVVDERDDACSVSINRNGVRLPIAVVFSAERYSKPSGLLDFSENLSGYNYAAHELTHGADIMVTKRHSELAIFKMICDLDSMFEKGGVANKLINQIERYSKYNKGHASYNNDLSMECFACASNSAGMAQYVKGSPMLDLYQKLVLTPALKMICEDEPLRLRALEAMLTHVRPEATLGTELGTQLNSYRTAETAEVRNAAGAALASAKEDVQALMKQFMTETVEDAHSVYKKALQSK